jgi:hypothetical protein
VSDDEVSLTTYQRLSERFPVEAHKTKSIGGRDLIYVDGEMVVSKLNEVLGFDGWSFEIGQITVLEDEVWATGKLTVYSGGRVIVREQAGGQIINRTRGIPARPAQEADGERPYVPAQPAQKGQVIELANDIKGAVTDCLKKCATLVGVGLYLYDPVERRELDAEMREAKRGGPKGPGTASTSSARTTAPSPTAAAQAVDPKVDAAARMTGATPTPIKPMVRCTECATDVAKDGSVTILKKKDGPKVTVSVADFEPVCIERLGSFHCANCYDRKYWGAA